MEELCQPTLNGRGGPIAPIAIQAMNFGLKNDMIQQVQNSCQFHGLPGDDANKHLDKFLHVTQSIKVNGVTDDALCLSESSSCIASFSDLEIVALKAEMAEINKNLMKVLQINQQVKAVAHNCENCGGPHSYNDCSSTVGQTQNANDAIQKNMQTNMTSLTNSNLKLKNMFSKFMKMNTASSSGLGTLLSNTITNPKEDLKGIITRSGNAYQGPTIPTTSSPPKVVERNTEVTKDTVPPTNNGSAKDVQPLEVLGFSVSGNPTPSTKPIVSTSSPTLTPFGDSDFLLKEPDAFLAIDDEPISLEINDCYYDSKGDILLLRNS
nr:reverse transcriptase domain-containing protein [Tanacetum cinerariifolium]